MYTHWQRTDRLTALRCLRRPLAHQLHCVSPPAPQHGRHTGEGTFVLTMCTGFLTPLRKSPFAVTKDVPKLRLQLTQRKNQTKTDASSYARARARSPSHTQPVWTAGPRYNVPSVTPVAARLGAWFPASLCSLKFYRAKRDGCEKLHFAWTLCRFTFRTGLYVVRPSANIVIFR